MICHLRIWLSFMNSLKSWEYHIYEYNPFCFHSQSTRMRVTVWRPARKQRSFRGAPIYSFSQPLFIEHICRAKAFVINWQFHFLPSQSLQSSEGQGRSSEQINSSTITTLINATKETEGTKSNSGDILKETSPRSYI